MALQITNNGFYFSKMVLVMTLKEGTPSSIENKAISLPPISPKSVDSNEMYYLNSISD